MKTFSEQKEELFEFARFLGQQSDYNEVVRLVAHKSALLLKADLALILMLNPDTRKTAKTIYKDGNIVNKEQKYRNIHIHIGGWVVNNKKPFFSAQLKKDKRFAKGLFEHSPVNSVAAVPLIIEGIVIGALILLYRDTPKFLKEKDLLSLLGQIAAVSTPFLRNVQKIREFFTPSLPESSLLAKYNSAGLFGKSQRFMDLLRNVEAAVKADTRVLLVGHTGTGKELIARAIHNFSSRSAQPFIAIDCGAIPPNLLESELFGHKRGAFTGASSERKGLFVEANGGTLFMDEINNLPFDMQSKLLRVLQEGEIRPVGSNRVVKTDVRLVAAASVSLKELMQEKKFREDLFYRLHVFPIYIPDLHERADDIPLLASHFLELYTRKQKKKTKKLHEELVDFIKWRKWPGNIRELENFIERIVTLATGNSSIIEPSCMPQEIKEELLFFRQQAGTPREKPSLRQRLDDYEAEILKQTLISCNWNQSQAARILHTSESNIRYKIEKLKINKSHM